MPAVPQDAPTLVLTVPGTPSDATRALAEEIVSISRTELSGLDPRIAYLDADGSEDSRDFPGLGTVLAQEAERERPEGSPACVVVPLLAGPEAAVLERIRAQISGSGVAAELTDVLGPHPLLAEALHVRLSEAGLARADRARLFTVATAADGIVLATTGGTEAVQAAGVTGLLLAARLAVPVMSAGLDVEGDVERIAEQLRASGSTRLALAPCVIGPELGEGLLKAATEAAGCESAELLGTYPALAKLVVAEYAAALGIALQQPQGAPAL